MSSETGGSKENLIHTESGNDKEVTILRQEIRQRDSIINGINNEIRELEGVTTSKGKGQNKEGRNTFSSQRKTFSMLRTVI